MNAASRLAGLLKQWRVKDQGKTVYVTRGGPNGGDEEFWNHQVDAALLLAGVRNIIADLRSSGEDVTDYETAFKAWARVVFAPDTAWNGTSNGRIDLGTATEAALLASLGRVADREPTFLGVNAGSEKSIRRALDDLVDLLAADDCPLTDQQKRYVLGLVSAVRRLLDEVDVSGNADLVTNLNALYGYLTIIVDVTEQYDPGFSQRVRDIADRVVPILRNNAVFAMAAIGTVADIKSITGH